ncbi:AAA family ATPase [Miltoncostaea marina]|uniref:AAA family ATPase n=1 Tax=Miltoncostaea marina TaxID=2843215 RepID=UPI001C3CEE72|nr:AAA family ATPase [Miltoncostaea marina]
MSKEQDRVNNLPLSGSHLVVGPPGTGKTVMALYRAQRLHKLGSKVLVITHSRLLSQYTDAAIQELGIDGVVTTFHSWFSRFYRRKYGTAPPTVEPYVYDWPTVLTRVNADPPTDGEIPYLIIDEGQDVPKEFYVLARLLATNLTVFADENQRITERNSTIKDIQAYGDFGDRLHKLTRNYRNTYEVAALADTFAANSTTGVAEPPTRRGEKPAMTRFPSLAATVDFIARFERANSDLEIGVFTSTKKVQQQFVNRLSGKTKNSVQAYIGGQGADADLLDFDTPGVKIVNYPSTKGLEFDAVFIPELQGIDGWHKELTDMQLYVMLSRARESLFLASSGQGEPRIRSRLPEELIEWK